MNRIALGILLACASAACTSHGMAPPASGNIPTEPLVDDTATQPAAGITPASATIATTPATPATVNHNNWLGAAPSSKYVLAGSNDEFIGVWVDVPEGKPQGHIPMSLTLTIDTSGSMAGEKIRHARQAARALVQNLEDGDLITVHVFSDRARELIAPTVISSRSRHAALSTISELSADGATNMFHALNLAHNRAIAAPASHPVRRIVMISDGRATAGPTDVNSLSAVAQRGNQHGVQVTSLGVGLDYDEETLNALAVKSSGRLYHLNDPREMTGIVKSELALLQQTMATGATLEVNAAQGVELRGASGVNAHWGASRSIRIPLGAMFSGQRREILVAYRITSDAVEGTQPIASARLVYNDPNDGGLQRVQESIVRAEFTTDPALVTRHQIPEVQAIIALEQSNKMAQAAVARVAAGDFDRADQELEKAEEQLRASAHRMSKKKDKSRILAQAERLKRSRGSVAGAKAAPKPAQAAAARRSALEVNDAFMGNAGF